MRLNILIFSNINIYVCIYLYLHIIKIRLYQYMTFVMFCDSNTNPYIYYNQVYTKIRPIYDYVSYL